MEYRTSGYREVADDRGLTPVTTRINGLSRPITGVRPLTQGNRNMDTVSPQALRLVQSLQNRLFNGDA